MNKKNLSIIGVVLGSVLALASLIFLRDVSVKAIGGVCMGVGTALIGICGSNLCMLRIYKKYPEEMKQAEIEREDERNRMIRNKAKALVSDIIQWVIMGAACITILMKSPLWVTMLIVGIFLLKNMLEIHLINKFQKEL